MRFPTIRRALLAPCLVVVALLSALPASFATALADSTPASDYSNICPGDSAATFQSALGPNANSAALVTSPNGHCVKFSVNGGARSSLANAHSGDLITLYGVGNWKPNRFLQIWESDAFPKRNPDHKFPLTNQIIGPDTDIHRECRTLIKGNQANPVETYATPQSNGSDQLAFDAVTFQAPAVTETSIFNIRVSIPNPPCTALPGSASEEQGTDALMIVQPLPTPTCVQQAGVCLTVAPQVVYPGQGFTVTGKNLPAGQTQLSIGIPQSSVCVALGALDASGSANLSAPPFTGLALTNQTNGIYHFQIYAGTATAACTSSAPQDLYVAPPSLSAPSQIIAGDSVNITGTSWIGGTPNSASATPLQIVAFVGSQNSFNCSTAKVLTLAGGTSPDGTFSFTYKAPDVSNTTNNIVRVAAISAGAATNTACQAFADATCQSATAGTNCPLIAATAPIQIITRPAAAINWIFILVPLGLLLLLLPLFFWLGRRDEEELIVTDKDVSRERVVLDATNSQRVQSDAFARTVQETRERVRLRDGKVLDEEVFEYDVFRGADGKEIRRLRDPHATNTPPATPPVAQA